MKGVEPILGAAASLAWLEDLGLSRPASGTWYVEVTVESDEPGTRVELNIYPEEWGFIFRAGSRVSSIRITDQPFVHGSDDHRLLAETPRLAAFPAFLDVLERRFGIEFRRATVRANLPRAGACVRPWLGVSA